MLKPKRALVLSVISLLSSLICAVQSEYRTSSNGSSNNAHFKYNHSSNINNISGSNVIEHNNPKAMKDLQRNPPPLDSSSNEKTAYQYAINDSDSGETPSISSSSSSSYPYFDSSSSAVHPIVENVTFDVASEGPSTSTRLAYHKKTAVRSAPYNYHEPHVKFAILLPESPRSRDSRILSTVRPVIEMATNVVTGPEGVLRNVKIEIDYRDTQCSSTYGALGAFDILLKRKPGNRHNKHKFGLLLKFGSQLGWVAIGGRERISIQNRHRMKFITPYTGMGTII